MRRGRPARAGRGPGGFSALTCNYGLPLFWLALFREADAGGAWAEEVEETYAEDIEEGFGPLRLAWPEAKANLAVAVSGAGARAPALAPLLTEWAAALEAQATRAGADAVELDLSSWQGQCRDAEELLGLVRERIQVWHGAEPPEPQALPGNAAVELTGFYDSTGRPFPRSFPGLQPEPAPAQPLPPPRPGVRTWRALAADWGGSLLGAGVAAAVGALGGWLVGQAGFYAGLVLGAVGFGVSQGRWRDRRARRR